MCSLGKIITKKIEKMKRIFSKTIVKKKGGAAIFKYVGNEMPSY